MTTRNRLAAGPALNRVGLALAAGALLALPGCSGVDALANHGELDVHTHMSESVFLDPVPDAQKTVYVGVRNTSDYPDIDVRGPLIQAIGQRGYTVVGDPGDAHYMVQVNVLQAGKLQPGQTGALLGASYGEPLLAGAIAGGLTAGGTGNYGAATGVGLGVAAATFLMNEAFQDVTYAVTTDIQISERPLHGEKVAQHTHTGAYKTNHASSYAVTESTPYSSGEADTNHTNENFRTQEVDEFSDYKKYQVRDVAYADKVNLKMTEAVPTLVVHLTSSLANLFE